MHYMPATAIQSVRPLPSRDGFFQCSAHILARPNGTAKRRRLSVGRLGPSRDLPARGRVLPVPPPWRGFRAGWSKQRNARYRFWMAYAGIEEHLWLVEFSNIPLSLGSGKCGSPDQPSIPLPLLSDIDIGSARRSISPSGSQHQRHTLIDDEFSGRACRFRESSNKFGLLAIKPVKHSRLYQTLIALVRDRTAALQRMGREGQASLGAAQMASHYSVDDANRRFAQEGPGAVVEDYRRIAPAQ